MIIRQYYHKKSQTATSVTRGVDLGSDEEVVVDGYGNGGDEFAVGEASVIILRI